MRATIFLLPFKVSLLSTPNFHFTGYKDQKPEMTGHKRFASGELAEVEAGASRVLSWAVIQ